MLETSLDPRFSDPGAKPTAWADAQRELEQARAYWLATVRADGRPAVADAYRVKYDDLFPYEVVDGRLQLENAPVEDGPAEVVAYRLVARKAFGFGKAPFSQTRWRFGS